MRWQWKKIGALFVVGLVVTGLAVATWFLTRPPKPAAMVDPAPYGRRITSGGLLANYYPVKGGTRGPGIVLLGGSEGGLARDLTRQAVLLQTSGFSVLHIAYHNAPGKPAHLASVPLEDFRRGLDWLKARPEVDAKRIGIVGYSKGAEAALLVATRYPGIKAAVAGMPSSVVWDGLSPLSIFLSLHSSWTDGERQIPALEYGSFERDRGMLSVFEGGLKTLAEHPDTVIPVERFAGRLLLVCGERDSLWPSCQMADQIVARAAKAGRPPTLLRYAEAGHGVMGAPGLATDRDIRAFAKLGGTAKANAAARADSWPKIIAFLKNTLETHGIKPPVQSSYDPGGRSSSPCTSRPPLLSRQLCRRSIPTRPLRERF